MGGEGGEGGIGLFFLQSMNRRSYLLLQGYVYLLGKLTVYTQCTVVVVHESVEGHYDVASVCEKNVAGNNQYKLKGFSLPTYFFLYFVNHC